MSTGLSSVVAFVQPFQLEKVIDALRSVPNFPGVSVSDVRGFGRLAAHPPRRGERTEVDPFDPKVRLEILCLGADVTTIGETIRRSAATGNAGDGIILVADVAFAFRIRTDEQGQDAVSTRPGQMPRE